ncbi:MAG: AbrB/MazE/SpoVT family DNA-binding domain-containing protein [Thermoanaerobaculia bacterium]
MTTRVGTKGQVVIDKAIRDQLGIQPGYLAIQRVVQDRVEISFLPPEHERSLRGVLAGSVRTNVAPGEDWHHAEEAAWRRAAWVAEGREGD